MALPLGFFLFDRLPPSSAPLLRFFSDIVQKDIIHIVIMNSIHVGGEYFLSSNKPRFSRRSIHFSKYAKQTPCKKYAQLSKPSLHTSGGSSNIRMMSLSPYQNESLQLKRQKLPSILSNTTIRKPEFSYIRLALLSPGSILSSTEVYVDEITARTHLTSALSQFLGLSGTAIAIDILKCQGGDVWIRVPQDDGATVTEALSGWVGNDVAWRIKGSGVWLGGLAMGDGRNMFG